MNYDVIFSFTVDHFILHVYKKIAAHAQFIFCR